MAFDLFQKLGKDFCFLFVTLFFTYPEFNHIFRAEQGKGFRESCDTPHPNFLKSPQFSAANLKVTVGLILKFLVRTNKIHIKNCYLFNLPVVCALVCCSALL